MKQKATLDMYGHYVLMASCSTIVYVHLNVNIMTCWLQSKVCARSDKSAAVSLKA